VSATTRIRITGVGCHHDQGQEERRDGQHRVDDAHHDRVEHAAEVPGDRAPEHTDDGGKRRRRDADLQGDLARYHQPPEHVVAVAVGAQGVIRARWHVLDREVHMDLVGVVKERPDETEREDRDEYRHAGDRELVLQEHVQAAAEGAARFAGREHARRDGRGLAERF
jgi:hypothetical protein